MKLAFVSTFDSQNVREWSGIGYFMRKSLENSGFQVVTIDKLHSLMTISFLIKRFIYSNILGKKYLRNREPQYQKFLAFQVKRKIKKINPDAILCAGTSPIAYLRTKKPIISWIDSTFDQLLNFYPQYENLCTETIENGKKTTQIALENCDLMIFSSQWAKESTLRNYVVDPEKIKVVPFGANLICNRNKDDILALIRSKSNLVCNLLFVGKDWFRKGGDFAVTVAEELNQRGMSTELNVVGCIPPTDLPSFVKVHGFISKQTEAGYKKLETLFSDAHFLIFPTKAETFGIVIAEASSYGLPSLSNKVGGITSVISDGKNGQTFRLEDKPEKYCDYIQYYFRSRELYEQLALSSFDEYNTRLNWGTSGREVFYLVQKLLSLKSGIRKG